MYTIKILKSLRHYQHQTWGEGGVKWGGGLRAVGEAIRALDAQLHSTRRRQGSSLRARGCTNYGPASSDSRKMAASPQPRGREVSSFLGNLTHIKTLAWGLPSQSHSTLGPTPRADSPGRVLRPFIRLSNPDRPRIICGKLQT